MGPVLLFVIMAIIACILILVASITASIGATDAFNSSYNGTNASGVIVADPKISTAAQYLTVAAALGWTSLVLLVVILIIGAVAGAFPKVEISRDMLQMNILTKDDLMVAYRGERELTGGQTMEIVILVVLIMIAIILLAIVILGAIAATDINNMKARDGLADSAYTMAIVTAATAAVALIALIVAIVAYFYIRSNRLKESIRLDALIKRSEAALSTSGVSTSSNYVGVPSAGSIAVTTPSYGSITTMPSSNYVGVPAVGSISVTGGSNSTLGSAVDIPRSGSVAVTTPGVGGSIPVLG
jgi:hypothetical protein